MSEATPNTVDRVTESVLVSERLGRIERNGDAMVVELGKLVALSERRDQRESEADKRRDDREAAELAERTARGAWMRSLVTPQVVTPIVAAIVTAITVYLGVASGKDVPEPAAVEAAP